MQSLEIMPYTSLLCRLHNGNYNAADSGRFFSDVHNLKVRLVARQRQCVGTAYKTSVDYFNP